MPFIGNDIPTSIMKQHMVNNVFPWEADFYNRFGKTSQFRARLELGEATRS